MVIFGGENIIDMNDLWIFHLDTHSWLELNSIKITNTKPKPRRFHTSILRGNQLIIIGGCYDKYINLNDIYYIDFSSFLQNGNI